MDEMAKPEANEETKAIEEENSPGAASAEPAAAEASDPLQALTAERDRLAEEKASLFDSFLRARADFDNLRKRLEKERKEDLHRVSMEVVREMLPVMDALERALASQGGDDEFRSGIQLIARQLWDTFTRLGLEPIQALGQTFDPHLHEAVERVETEDHDDQAILTEWQRGYLFRTRLLRPAMVKVAVRKVQ
jgi:molecular chaperone GrpE